MPLEPMAPTEQKYTRWKNPTDSRIVADVYVGNPSAHNPSGRMRFTWAPGEVKTVPSEFDQAIREERGGLVLGLAPQLRKVEAGESEAAPAAAPAEPRPARRPAPAPTDAQKG